MRKVFLTEKELATRWNLAPKTLRQWRWDQKGPKYFKMSGRVSYRSDDIEKYEEDKEVPKLKDTKRTRKSD